MDPLQVFEKLGFPLGALCFLCLALWRAGKWAAPLFEKLVENTTSNTEAVKLMDARNEAHHAELVRHVLELKAKVDTLVASLIVQEDAA